MGKKKKKGNVVVEKEEVSEEEEQKAEDGVSNEKISDEESEPDNKVESKGKMKQRHLQEIKELQKKTQDMLRNIGKSDKKAKKDVEDQIFKLEQELNQRHASELQALEEREKADNENAQAISTLSLYASDQQKELSKAQKKKVARNQQEKEREERIRAEKKNTISHRDIEYTALMKKLIPVKMRVKEITPDGNCLYSAVADQLSLHGIKMVSETLRKTAAEYMIKNSSEFMPFIDAEEGIISEEKFTEYCHNVANTPAWGGQLELKALVHALKTPITIFTADEKAPNIEMGQEYVPTPTLYLSYLAYSLRTMLM